MPSLMSSQCPSDRAPIRIAMWSGPRNISTALMRSFGSRADTFVTDEPLYAHYLRQTDLDHPGRDEILADQENDAGQVIDWLTGPIPGGRAVWYQKHMCHHILEGMDTAWFAGMRHAFLLREPEAMITSLIKVIPNPSLEETGLPGQLALFERARAALGKVPPVIDSRDVLLDPAGVLDELCRQLEIPWDPAMLKWAPGPRQTDGIWARHWYANVETSTGFGPYRRKDETVPMALTPLLREARAIYDQLAAERITTPLTREFDDSAESNARGHA